MVATTGYTKFKKGARIVVCLRDGQRVSGAFVGSRGDAVAIATTDPSGKPGTLIMPKRSIAFMRAEGTYGT